MHLQVKHYKLNQPKSQPGGKKNRKSRSLREKLVKCSTNQMGKMNNAVTGKPCNFHRVDIWDNENKQTGRETPGRRVGE